MAGPAHSEGLTCLESWCAAEMRGDHLLQTVFSTSCDPLRSYRCAASCERFRTVRFSSCGAFSNTAAKHGQPCHQRIRRSRDERARYCGERFKSPPVRADRADPAYRYLPCSAEQGRYRVHPGGRAEFGHCGQLHLPDRLAVDPVNLTYLAQGVALAVDEPEPQLHHAGLPL